MIYGMVCVCVSVMWCGGAQVWKTGMVDCLYITKKTRESNTIQDLISVVLSRFKICRRGSLSVALGTPYIAVTLPTASGSFM